MIISFFVVVLHQITEAVNSIFSVFVQHVSKLIIISVIEV